MPTEKNISEVRRSTDLFVNKVISAQDWVACVLGEEYRGVYSDEYARRASTFFKIFLDGEESDYVVESDNGNMDELLSIKEELFKERVRLQDELREKRGQLREEARFEKICEVLHEELRRLPEVPSCGGFVPGIGVDNVTAVLCLSDWHCGAVVDSQFNFYNIEEMERRANIIAEKTIARCGEHCVNHLVVEIGGDMIDGLINVSGRTQQEEDAISQIVTVSNTLTAVLNKLAPWFEDVKVYCVLGNHSRMVPNKKECVTHENFETLIPVFLRERLKGVENVTIIDSKGLDFLKYNIGEKVICMAHGQNDSLHRCVDDFSKMYKVVPAEVHLAHTHAYKDINDNDCLVNVNGSLIGANDYSVGLRKVTKPSQNLIVYGEDRCVYSLSTD